jgi:hypothetical protein
MEIIFQHKRADGTKHVVYLRDLVGEGEDKLDKNCDLNILQVSSLVLELTRYAYTTSVRRYRLLYCRTI